MDRSASQWAAGHREERSERPLRYIGYRSWPFPLPLPPSGVRPEHVHPHDRPLCSCRWSSLFGVPRARVPWWSPSPMPSPGVAGLEMPGDSWERLGPAHRRRARPAGVRARSRRVRRRRDGGRRRGHIVGGSLGDRSEPRFPPCRAPSRRRSGPARATPPMTRAHRSEAARRRRRPSPPGPPPARTTDLSAAPGGPDARA